MKLQGARALVTGGAVRVGRALTVALAREGCRVAVHFHDSAAAARLLAAELATEGIELALVQADLTQAPACGELFQRASERLGGLDVLVNSAGTFPQPDLIGTDLATWEGQMALGVRAPFLLAQSFARQARAAGARGSIVNVTDARVARPRPGQFAYRVGKSALEAMTKLLAVELAPDIRVNAIAPGALLPPRTEGGPLTEMPTRTSLTHSFLGTEPAVEALLYLLRADLVTGQVLRVDGGEFS